jgi:hypothetical protein
MITMVVVLALVVSITLLGVLQTPLPASSSAALQTSAFRGMAISSSVPITMMSDRSLVASKGASKEDVNGDDDKEDSNASISAKAELTMQPATGYGSSRLTSFLYVGELFAEVVAVLVALLTFAITVIRVVLFFGDQIRGLYAHRYERVADGDIPV